MHYPELPLSTLRIAISPSKVGALGFRCLRVFGVSPAVAAARGMPAAVQVEVLMEVFNEAEVKVGAQVEV